MDNGPWTYGYYRSEEYRRNQVNAMADREERRQSRMDWDEIHESPLPRVILDRLRLAKEQGRKVVERRECTGAFSLVAVKAGMVTFTVYQTFCCSQFERIAPMIRYEWTQMNAA